MISFIRKICNKKKRKYKKYGKNKATKFALFVDCLRHFDVQTLKKQHITILPQQKKKETSHEKINYFEKKRNKKIFKTFYQTQNICSVFYIPTLFEKEKKKTLKIIFISPVIDINILFNFNKIFNLKKNFNIVHFYIFRLQKVFFETLLLILQTR